MAELTRGEVGKDMIDVGDESKAWSLNALVTVHTSVTFNSVTRKFMISDIEDFIQA
jgi:hypothetical protein